MGNRESVEALQWLAYIGRTRSNVTYTGNGRQVHLVGFLNLKLMGTVHRRGKSLSKSGALGMAVFACSIDTDPLVRQRNLQNRYETKRDRRKSRTSVIRLF